MGTPVFYAVGGSVRDGVLGRTPADHDFAVTGCTLPEMKAAILAKGCAIRRESARFPFIAGILNGVKADFLLVSDLREWLSHHDFTMNAMARDAAGALTDPYGGAADIAAKRIRCTGNAMDRFKERPAAMLRAIRFSALLGFSIDPEILGCFSSPAAAALLRNCEAAPVCLELARVRQIKEARERLAQFPLLCFQLLDKFGLRI